MNIIYLSRRNLQTLINKLDRRAAGGSTAATIIKHQNKDNPPEYQQTLKDVTITAVEDADFYVNREGGVMHPADDPALKT